VPSGPSLDSTPHYAKLKIKTRNNNHLKVSVATRFYVLIDFEYLML
jgi:hypothetical protein